MKSTLAKAGAAVFAVACTVAYTVACGGDPTNPDRPDPTSSNLGSMSVGDVRTLTFTQASGGLQIPAALSSAQYAIILGNSNVASPAIPSVTVHGDWMTSQAVGPLASFAPPTGQSLSARGSTTPRGAMFEASLRNFERTQLPRPGGATQSGGLVSLDKLPPAPSRATAPAVGATLQIKVLTPSGFNGTGSVNCSTGGFTVTTGKVRAVGKHALVVSDVTSPAGGFTDADFQGVADEFDSFTFPTDSAYFGSPTDLDNNDHIIIYYTPAVNRLTPTGDATSSGYVGGFFFAGDLYDPIAGSKGCLSSNKGEYFYLLAPDASAINGNDFTADFVRQVTRGTVAHEFQHMINSGNRYVSPTISNFEATWLDEGLAHMAEDVVGRARAGFGDNFTVAFADVDKLSAPVLQAYFLQNFARTKYYVGRPDTTGAIVGTAKAANNLASRGAEWAFLRYLDDWYSGTNPRILTRKLVAGPDTGTVNLTKSAGAPLDTLLSRWLVTMYTDHRSIPGLNAVYNYKSYTLRQLVAGTQLGNENVSSYLPVKAIGDGRTTVQANVPGSSANYFLTSLTTGGARTVTVTNSGGSAATDPNGRIYIVRQQ
ncbi:MAG: hypothetical protein ACR2GG_08665 [Gemmatimonadaceae bacterium]